MNFTAAELRALIVWFQNNRSLVCDEECNIETALIEYATLIETVLDGGDGWQPMLAVIEEMQSYVGGAPRVFGDRLAAALPAIRLRLLADTVKEGK